MNSDASRTRPHRCPNPYPLADRVGRVVWSVAYWLVFRPTPRRFMDGWRRFVLRRFGARLGWCGIHPTVRISAPWKLEVGDDVWIDAEVLIYNHHGVRIDSHVTISRGAFLCSTSHDYTRPHYPIIGAPVVVQTDAWVAADAFLAPGVTVGQGAVVGARAAVFKDVEPWTVVGGNPAKFIKRRELREEA